MKTKTFVHFNNRHEASRKDYRNFRGAFIFNENNCDPLIACEQFIFTGEDENFVKQLENNSEVVLFENGDNNRTGDVRIIAKNIKTRSNARYGMVYSFDLVIIDDTAKEKLLTKQGKFLPMPNDKACAYLVSELRTNDYVVAANDCDNPLEIEIIKSLKAKYLCENVELPNAVAEHSAFSVGYICWPFRYFYKIK